MRIKPKPILTNKRYILNREKKKQLKELEIEQAAEQLNRLIIKHNLKIMISEDHYDKYIGFKNSLNNKVCSLK